MSRISLKFSLKLDRLNVNEAPYVICKSKAAHVY